MDIKNLISKAITKSLGSKENIFDLFIEEYQVYLNGPCHTLSDLKQKKCTKNIGDGWELFSTLYLQHIRGMTHVWRLSDIPEDIRIKLNLRKQDIGIDIIAMDKYGSYYAIQCKYKAPKPNKTVAVGWKELSTFYALCAKTGPWVRHIVITSASYIRHMGLKTEKDLSICIGTFRALNLDQWYKLAGSIGHILSETSTNISHSDVDTVREARLKRFSAN